MSEKILEEQRDSPEEKLDASQTKRQFTEPKLTFIEPKLKKLGEITKITSGNGFFGPFTP